MSLSLIAEQRSVSKLFLQREQYVIPDFQRPYSWRLEQCRKLFDDIIEAYNAETDYFLGNIIIAVGERAKDKPHVVDGQQRIISLWIILKVLSVLKPDVRTLNDAICTYNWDGSKKDLKINSEVIESDDKEWIRDIDKWTERNFEDGVYKCMKNGEFVYPVREKSLVANALYFYYTYKSFLEENGQEELHKYLRFLLEQVSILPIELVGSNQEEANNKALTIFETINNRGMDLSDADIFKAKLYAKALTKEEQEDFMSHWTEFKKNCKNIKLSIDDGFRYYSHVLRGKAGTTKNEISLRDFFASQNSPLSQKSYQEVMKDLLRIIELLTQYEEKKKERTELAAWLQLIDNYTNVYPKYAALVYLFHNGFDHEEKLIETLKRIVRYCYYRGSTTYVKYEVYNMICQISQRQMIDEYYQDDIGKDYFEYMGRLKYGYALLALYLEEPKALALGYEYDRLLTTRDIGSLPSDWTRRSLVDHLDDLGNLAVLDTYKRSQTYSVKSKAYAKTCIKELRDFINMNMGGLSFSEMKRRTQYKKTILINFFTGK